MTVGNATNDKFFTYISPTINFKTTGITLIFTTLPNVKFIPTMFSIISDTATAANGDMQFNVGWTAAAYNDYIFGSSSSITLSGNFQNYFTLSALPIPPASTGIYINITSGETGTALTGRVIFNGIYID